MIRRMLSDQLEAIGRRARSDRRLASIKSAPPVEFEAGNFIREA